MTRLSIEAFKKMKKALKNKTVTKVAEKFAWSKTTVRRIQKARSLKQYRELCMAY